MRAAKKAVAKRAPTAKKATPASATAAKAAPARKAAPAKAPAAKAPAVKAAPAKEAALAKKVTPLEQTSAEVGEPDLPAPVTAAKTPRKKSAPRKAVPKQPGSELVPAAPPVPALTATDVTAPAAAHPIAADAWHITGRILDHPAYAPELLAIIAVRLIGPRAAAWAEATRANYPAATEAGLARLATRRFVRLAAVGGTVAHVAGLFAPVAELATVALTQAGLALHLAAAYGHDPAHPDRAADLLVLTRVHADEKSAHAALAAAQNAQNVQEAQNIRKGTDEQLPSRAVEAGVRLAVPLATQTGGWLALRLAARAVPGAALLVAGAGSAATAERLAARAAAHYRGRRPAEDPTAS